MFNGFSLCKSLDQFIESIDNWLSMSPNVLDLQKTEICLFLEAHPLFLQSSASNLTAKTKIVELINRISKDIKPGTPQEQALDRVKLIMSTVFESYLPIALPVKDSIDEPIVALYPFEKGSEQAPSAPAIELMSPLLSNWKWAQIEHDLRLLNAPRWHETEKTRQVASFILYSLSFASGVAAIAVGSGLVLVATPIEIIAATAALTAMTVTLAVSGHITSPKGKMFWKDPAFIVRSRREAEQDIVKNNLSFYALEKKYRPLLQEQLITNEDLNRLFRQRIVDPQLSYGELRVQLVQNPIGAPFKFGFKLDSINQPVIRDKVLDPSWHGESSLGDNELHAIGLSRLQISMKIVNRNYSQLLHREASFEQFAENMKGKWSYLNQEQLDAVRPFAIQYYTKNHHGLNDAMEEEALRELKIGYEELIGGGALKSDITRLNEGTMTYVQFRKKHSAQAIRIHQLQQHPQEEKEAVKKAFLRSYPAMHDYSADAIHLGIDDHQSRMKLKFQEEMRSIQSFDQIIQKLGPSVFEENLLSKESPLLIRLVYKKMIDDSSYHIPLSSPLIQYDLIPHEAKKAITSAQEQEDAILQKYQADETLLQRDLINLNGKFRDEYAASARERLQPLELKLQIKIENLDNELAKLKKLDSSIEHFKIRSEERDKTAKELKEKETELENLEARAKELGVAQQGKHQELLSKRKELRNQFKRRDEVLSLLADIKIQSELEKKQAKLLTDIAILEQRPEIETKTAGIGSAIAALREESSLKEEKNKLKHELKQIESRLAKAAESNVTDLNIEAEAFTSLDQEFNEVEKEIQSTELKEAVAKQRENLSAANQILRDKLSQKFTDEWSETLQFGADQILLSTAESQIIQLKEEIARLNVSAKLVETELKTRLATLEEAAQMTFESKTAELLEKKQKELTQIQEDYLKELDRLIKASI